MSEKTREAVARRAFHALHVGPFDGVNAYRGLYERAERTIMRQGRYIICAQRGCVRHNLGPFEILSKLQASADKMRRLWDRLSAPSEPQS